MKLIDILVERLPALGGWPIDSDDERTLISSLPGVSWGLNGGGYYAFRGPNDSITYQQYEAAIVASKAEWDGEGLPPVGCECQIILGKNGDLGVCEVLFIGSDIIVWRQKSTFAEGSSFLRNVRFLPIRSGADKSRNDAVKALKDIIGGPGGPYAELKAREIYHAIKSGKIVID